MPGGATVGRRDRLKIYTKRRHGRFAVCSETESSKSLQSIEGAQGALYEVLAGYYGQLAADFRQAIAKR
jgi:hypothetical protein